MSGGSYDYLDFAVHMNTLVPRVKQIEQVAERLKELGEPGAAEETAAVAQAMRDCERAAVRLQKVWHAVEWLDSGDSGPEEVHEACKELP